jgi:hypothetical protein
VAIIMNVDTWAVVLATIVGPIAAVFITRWNDHRREARGRLLNLYRTLMATRKMAISEEHVAAINMIKLNFMAWNRSLKHGRPISHISIRLIHLEPKLRRSRRQDRRAELLAMLLVKIAANLGITKGEIEILHGGYAPQGWVDRDLRIATIQDYIIRLSKGESVLPVNAQAQPTRNNPYPPPP